jgi:hypothetical protein
MQRSELRRDSEESWFGVKAKVREVFFFFFWEVREVNGWNDPESKRSVFSPWDGVGVWNQVGWQQRGPDHVIVYLPCSNDPRLGSEEDPVQ